MINENSGDGGKIPFLILDRRESKTLVPVVQFNEFAPVR